MFRRIFSDNPTFYRIYYHLVRKHRGIRPPFFTSTTDIFYDGYPRSGNTFLNQLIINVFPGLKGVHHLHKIAPIKIALKNSIEVFILIRVPDEAISSNYLKYYAPKGIIPDELNFHLLSRITDDYYHYYSFINNNFDKIHLIPFNELINNPTKFIRIVADKLDIDIDNHALNEKVKRAIDLYGGAKTKYGSSKPNIHKEREKEKIKEKLLGLENHKRVKQVYHEIIDQYGNNL